MPTKSPVGIVKEKFGDKAKLVEAVKAFAGDAGLWVGRLASDRGKERGLEHVSNAKLLRLHRTFTEVKDAFGTREKLVAALLESEGRTKDEGFKKRVSEWPVPRLWDAYKSAKRRAKGRAAAAAPAAAPPAAEAPKATKKKAAAATAPAEKPAAKRTKKTTT